MDTEFETAKAEFRKVIQKCIDMKWITVNENLSLDGLASQFANKLSDMNRDKKERETIATLVWMKNYYPENLINILSFFKKLI